METRTVSYDLGQWNDEQRDLLWAMLDGRGIPYEVDGDELTVLTTHEASVDRMLDNLGEPAVGAVGAGDRFTVLRRLAVAIGAAVALWQAAALVTPGDPFSVTLDCDIVVVELFSDAGGAPEFDVGDFGSVQTSFPECRDLARRRAIDAAVHIAVTGAAVAIALRVLREDGPLSL